MSALQNTRPAPFGAISTYYIVDAFDHILFAIRSRVAMRQTRRNLERLSDAQLDDIGLTRAQIDTVAAGSVTY